MEQWQGYSELMENLQQFVSGVEKKLPSSEVEKLPGAELKVQLATCKVRYLSIHAWRALWKLLSGSMAFVFNLINISRP